MNTLLLKEVPETLPAKTAVTRPVNRSIAGVHQDSFILEAAPHEVVDLAIEVECLEVNLGRHILFLLLVLVRVTSHASSHGIGQHTRSAERGQQSYRFHPTQIDSFILFFFGGTLPLFTPFES